MSLLQDRLDAANALKKQMWAEAQLDKRRMKEESIRFPDSSLAAVREGSQSPLAIVDNKNYEASLSTPIKEEPSMGAENVQNHLSNVHDSSPAQITPPIQQNGNTVERARMQLKSFIGHRAEEMYVHRSLPLGQDRRRNRYWQFVACASRHDPGSGRIFVELSDGYWRLIDSEEVEHCYGFVYLFWVGVCMVRFLDHHMDRTDLVNLSGPIYIFKPVWTGPLRFSHGRSCWPEPFHIWPATFLGLI